VSIKGVEGAEVEEDLIEVKGRSFVTTVRD